MRRRHFRNIAAATAVAMLVAQASGFGTAGAGPDAGETPNLAAPARAAAPTQSAEISDEMRQALGNGALYGSSEIIGNPDGVAILKAPKGSFNGFPTDGDSALILSTGKASIVDDPDAGAKEHVINGDQIGTDLGNTASVDGHDMTQLRLGIAFEKDKLCLSFDYLFLSEEFPNFVGKKFNDTFTAEYKATNLSLSGTNVASPGNFALGQTREPVSINSFQGFLQPAEGTTLNAKSPVMTASVMREGAGSGNPSVFLTVQDLGDSDLDTAVIIDNLRFEASCPDNPDTVDTDGDGLPDVWETKGIDWDRDGTPELDLPTMGANPARKDLFIEFDWMYEDPTCVTAGSLTACPANDKDKTPSPKALAAVVDAFAKAPVSNPDGSTGITLHIDAGPDSPMKPDGTKWGTLSRATRVPFVEHIADSPPNFNDGWDPFDAIAKQHFDPVRSDAFHYGVYGHKYGDTGSSGQASLPGQRFFLTDGGWNGTDGFTLRQEAGTFMHEFGHNLGFEHNLDKSDNTYQPGYFSIMSYCFQNVGLDAKGATGEISGLDYSRTGTGQQVDTPCTESGQGASKTRIPVIEHDQWADLAWLKRGPIGGAIGSGGTQDEPEVSDDEPLTAEKAQELGVNAAPGDGLVAVVGPDLFAAGVEGQSVLVDVTNVSAVETTYRVEIAEPWLDEPVEVTVAPYETSRVEIPLKVARVTDGPTPVVVSLYNGDALLSESTRDFHAVDLTDESVARDMADLLDQMGENPPEGYDEAAVSALKENVEPVLGDEVTPELVSEPKVADLADEGTPIWLVAAVAGGALVIAALAATWLRRRARRR